MKKIIEFSAFSLLLFFVAAGIYFGSKTGVYTEAYDAQTFEQKLQHIIIQCGDSDKDGIILKSEEREILGKFLRANGLTMHQGIYYRNDGDPVMYRELKQIVMRYEKGACPF